MLSIVYASSRVDLRAASNAWGRCGLGVWVEVLPYQTFTVSRNVL